MFHEDKLRKGDIAPRQQMEWSNELHAPTYRPGRSSLAQELAWILWRTLKLFASIGSRTAIPRSIIL
jgi:hypothetical protein